MTSVWSTPYSINSIRMAEVLARQALTGVLHARAQQIFLHAQKNPRWTAELVLALAELASRSVTEDLDGDEERAFVRAAHSTYERYRRAGATHLLPDWALRGERLYHRRRNRLPRNLKHRRQPPAGEARAG